MNYLFCDVETTIKNKGSPHTKGNELCYIGLKENGQPTEVFRPVQKEAIYSRFNPHTLVGFNLKFDLAWLYKYGIDIYEYTIWDCQLAEFILSYQTIPYPSLEDTCQKYGIKGKDDRVAEYWNQGIDTPEIPEEIITEYLTQDVECTYQIFLQQWKQFKKHPELLKLFRVQCEDLLVLLDMETNGLKFDAETAKVKEHECSQQIEVLEEKLIDGYWGVPINWDSVDHLSAYFYGGSIIHTDRIPNGIYKTGLKAGQTKFKLVEHKFDLPGFVEPNPKSKLKKEGLYSTDEPTLRSLKGNAEFKKRRDLILERARVEKLRGTYFAGLLKTIKEQDWEPDELHGQFNQVVARTGRLSSSRPNLQNFAEEAQRLIYTRYKHE